MRRVREIKSAERAEGTTVYSYVKMYRQVWAAISNEWLMFDGHRGRWLPVKLFKWFIITITTLKAKSILQLESWQGPNSWDGRRKRRGKEGRMKVWRSLSFSSGCYGSPMELSPLGCSEPTSGRNHSHTSRTFQDHLHVESPVCSCRPECHPSHLGPWEGSLQGYDNFLHLSRNWPLEPALPQERGNTV